MKLKSLCPKWAHTLYMCYYTFGYDLKRFLSHSFGYNQDTEGVKANLLMLIHTLEKGLTMPNSRCGFGKDKIFQIKKLVCTIADMQPSSYEMQYAKELLEDYIDFHNTKNYLLSQEIIEAIDITKNKIISSQNKENIHRQLHYSKKDFFIDGKATFKDWAFSRHTCRNYSDKPIPKDVFYRVAIIANQAPSSCNRQSCKMHVITEKTHVLRVLNVQGGCRGFGHLATAAIIITADLHCFYDVQERSQPAINSGFFGMNILYALHQEGIGACVLNWSNTRKRDLQLRKLVPTIKNNEQIEFLISCGYPPSEFDIALSKRRNVEDCIFFTEHRDH